MQTSPEFITGFLSFTGHIEAGEARQGSSGISQAFKRHLPRDQANLVKNRGIGGLKNTLPPIFIDNCFLYPHPTHTLNTTLIRINISISLLENSYEFTKCQVTCYGFKLSINKNHKLTVCTFYKATKNALLSASVGGCHNQYKHSRKEGKGDKQKLA